MKSRSMIAVLLCAALLITALAGYGTAERPPSTMTDELVRLPYFSQTTDESWIYTYPSLNIAVNGSVAEEEGKLDAAMKVLNCFLWGLGNKAPECLYPKRRRVQYDGCAGADDPDL